MLVSRIIYTVVHDFNGHEVNGIHGLYGKKGHDGALYSVNKRHDVTLPEFMTLTEIFPTTIFSVKIMNDCIVPKWDWFYILNANEEKH